MRHVILLLLAAILCSASESAPAPVYDEVTIENGQVRVAVSTLRASIRRVELIDTKPIELPRHARNGPSALPDGPLPVLRSFAESGNHNWIYSENGGLTADPWKVDKSTKSSVQLSFQAANGLVWTMAYALAPNTLEIGAQLSVRNQGTAAAPLELHVFPVVGVHADYAQSEVGYQSVFTHAGGVTGAITNHGMPTISTPGAPVADMAVGAGGTGVDFIGVKSRFFAAWWKPAAAVEEAVPVKVADKPQGLDGMVHAAPAGTAVPAADWQAFARGFQGVGEVQQAWLDIAYGKVSIEPGASWQRGWSITTASMTKKHIAMLPEAEQVVKYTDGFYRFFKILANALAWVLDFLAKAMPYGVAVIVLTILIKGALYRTTYKQQESMLKMQKVSPELKYIQEQYKNNKQMLAQKQMELFKKHGVNPLGGCLPMFIQLPIFIALFQAFSHCADLRGSGFLWISDLTLPDQVIGVPLSFLGGWVLTLNPLPIIYIGVSAWMSFNQTPPSNNDPQQEMMFKMMRWMPVIFGVIFYNMPSGLVLYFTVQAVISTLEMKYIKRKLGLG